MKIEDLGLRIVPVEKIIPHEQEDPRRVERLSGLLRKEGWLKNPPLVVEHNDIYAILDGTTRTGAMASLGYKHMLVQVVEPDRVRVATWNHLVVDRNVESFWEECQQLPLVSFHPLSGVSLAEYQTRRWAGSLQLADDRIFSIDVPPDTNAEEELNVLKRLVALYTGEREIRRSIKVELHELVLNEDDLTAVVSFPSYSVRDIMHFAANGLRVPPGITRCIIPGRILRVNLDLSLLNSEVLTLEQKNARLHEYLHARLLRQPLRYYEEPIYILED